MNLHDDIDLEHERSRAYQNGLNDGILQALVTFGILLLIGVASWAILSY